MKPKKALIVEDSKLQAGMYKIIFAKYKTELIFAENGKVALEILTNMVDTDLIVTDIEMPEMDGLKFLDIIRKSGLVKCPVIVISTKDNLDKLKKSIEIGATAYVVKPWNMGEFQGMIENIVV